MIAFIEDKLPFSSLSRKYKSKAEPTKGFGDDWRQKASPQKGCWASLALIKLPALFTFKIKILNAKEKEELL